MSDDNKIGPLTVHFRTGIRPDGEIARLSLEQYESRIELTQEQAESLVRFLGAKFGYNGPEQLP